MGEPDVRHSIQQASYMALRLRVLHHEQQLPSIGDHFHIQQPSFMDNRCVSAVPTNTPTPSVPQLRGTHNTRDELDFVVSEQRAVWRYGQHVEVDCFRLPHLPGHKASKQRGTRRHTGVRHTSVAITR